MDKTIKAQSTKKNFIFQFLYQVVMLVIPLITAPYLTRRLGDTSLGVYSYTYSIAYYFVIFAMLGISRHGQRVIAARRDDNIALRKTFWSLYAVHACFSILAFAVYIVFALFFSGEYSNIYILQAIYVASALFDITWLFYGLENFRSVVIKNLAVKISECVLIFCLIKSSDDLWLYTLIMSCSLCVGQAVMLPQAIAYVKPIKFGWTDVKEHFKPLFVLFISVLAATLYTVFDKTLLGLMSTTEDVAYYEYSNKIITMPKTFIAVIGTVLFPRACACFARGEDEKAKKYIDYSVNFTYFIGAGAIFGLLAVSNLLAVKYFGESFAVCGNVMMVMSPVILIVGLGDILRVQYMIPNHMDKQYVICLVLNAIINLILSAALIPALGIYGAVVGTLAAELFGLIFQMIICRRFISIKKILLTSIPYIICGGVMFGIIYIIKLFYNTSTLHLLFQVGIGAFVYIVLCAVYMFALSPIKHQLREKVGRVLKKPFKSANVDNNKHGGGYS